MITEHIKDKEQNIVKYALSFRKPMQVIKFQEYWQHDCYPMCPRCNQCLNREYLNYCYHCGQRLSWKYFNYKTLKSVNYD